VTVELAIGLADIVGTLIMALALILSMQATRRDRDARVADTAKKDQKYTDDIAHIEREAGRAYDKAQEVANHVNERFEKLESRQRDGDILTAEIGSDVKHVLEGITTLAKGQSDLAEKLDRHVNGGGKQ
jgi:seryl-tRNA synthetase